MRIGVYVCHCGGNISETVDVKAVAAAAEQRPGVVLARDYSHMCSDLGQKLILKDIKEHNLDRVVVAACSPHFQGATFMNVLETGGLSPYVFEMANIREQCAWPHFGEPETATLKSIELTNMAIAKAGLDESLQKKTMPIGKRVLVIGGGIAGIQASLDLADSGFEVHLVEKDPSIGGKMAQLSRTFPTEDCSACILSPKMADVPANPDIELLTYSEIESVEGYLGNFEVTVVRKSTYVDPDLCTACGLCEDACPVKVPSEFEVGLRDRKAIYVPFDFAVPYKYLIDESVCLRLTKGGEVCGLCQKACPKDAIDFSRKSEKIRFTVDTIVVATGYDIFDATEKKVYGYGEYKNVITALEMERMIVNGAAGTPIRPIKGRIGFIQCVGSRDEQVGNEYCSRVCCMYATKLSQLLKRSDPTREIYVFYTDLRAFGKGFEEYYKRAQTDGVKFVRGRVAELLEDPVTKSVTVKVEDTLSRQMIEAEFDLVILSVGLKPNAGTERVAEILKLTKSPDGFLQEAHPKFRPVDTLKEGIFLAGAVQGPKDIPDAVASASAAAARAVRLMNQGEFSLDPVLAYVHEDICDGCSLCVESCLPGAISISSNVAQINETLCTGCGICIAACPIDAMDLHCYANDQLLAEVEAAVSERRDGETRIIVFADDTTTYRLADNVGTGKLPYAPETRIIRVPSGTRATPALILKALALGIDGVFVGESESKSSPYAGIGPALSRNIEQTRAVLREHGIEPERVRAKEFVTIMLGGFVAQLNELTAFAENAGPVSEKKRKALDETLANGLPRAEAQVAQ